MVATIKFACTQFWLCMVVTCSVIIFLSPTETAEAAIEAFKRAAKQAGTFAPMIHTDRGAAYTSKDFNNYLTSNDSKQHSLSAPGTPADNAVIEHYWGDFKYIWMAHHSHPQTLT